MNREIFSNELKTVIDYMIDVLQDEFPTKKISNEYIILSLLDTKCHVSVLLDRFLMSSNIGEIRAIYEKWLEEHQANVKSIDKKDVDYSDLDKILEKAEEERVKCQSDLLCSEHVLLAMINENDSETSNVKKVFETLGVTYNFIYEKCVEITQEQKKREQAIQKNNNEALKVPIKKSEVNQKVVTQSTKYISQFTISLNELVNQGKIDPLVGRHKEIEQIVKILARRKKNNVVVLGNSGCGKSALIEGLAARILVDNVPPTLSGKEIVKLNVMALVSGTHFRGMFEERVNGLFSELKQSDKYILFFDDVQQVLKSGSKDKDTDLSSYIADILTSGEVKVIATCNFKDYRNTIENNPQLASKFQRLILEPATKEEAFDILKVLRPLYENFHNVRYSDEVLQKAIDLAERFNTSRCLPDSAIDVIDLSGAYTCLINKEPKEITEARKRLIKINDEKEELLNNGDFELAEQLTETEVQLKRQISTFNRMSETNREKYTITITEEDIMKSVSELTNVPVSKLQVNEKQKLAHIEETLKQYIVGQDEAVESVCKVIKRNKVGLGDKNRPLGVFLLTGKSGTGKCVSKNTKIKIRNKKTLEIKEITIEEFISSLKK